MTSASNVAGFFNPPVFMGPAPNPIIWMGILQWASVGGGLDPGHLTVLMDSQRGCIYHLLIFQHLLKIGKAQLICAVECALLTCCLQRTS